MKRIFFKTSSSNGILIAPEDTLLLTGILSRAESAEIPFSRNKIIITQGEPVEIFMFDDKDIVRLMEPVAPPAIAPILAEEEPPPAPPMAVRAAEEPLF